jgi:hypothetical protein
VVVGHLVMVLAVLEVIAQVQGLAAVVRLLNHL